MIIRAITIENFKSIKTPVRIELRPITLLYGPNSVGKSSIIQALHYAREIMIHLYPSSDLPESGGGILRLGGFQNLVHNHDLNNAIRFRFELDTSRFGESGEEPFGDCRYSQTSFYDLLSRFPEDIQQVTEIFEKKIEQHNLPWFELVIQQLSPETVPHVTAAAIGFGEVKILSIQNDLLKKFDAFNKYMAIRRTSLGQGEELKQAEQEYDKCVLQITHLDVNDPLLLIENKQFLSSIVLNNKVLSRSGYEEDFPRISVSFRDLSQYYEDHSKKEIAASLDYFGSYLDAIYQIIVKTVMEDLDDFRYVGPLREIPSANFIPSPGVESHRWANGLAAWDYVRYNRDDSIENTNFWFSELRVGYKVVLKEYRKLDINTTFYKALAEQSNYKQWTDIQKELEKLPIEKKVIFQDINSGIELEPTDVGVGISQVFPLIPLILSGEGLQDMNRHGMVAIEQPELHIHPAMQATLADLFEEGLGNQHNCFGWKRFIIETHSEHLLLRFLRRIREGSTYICDDLSINFLEPSKDGVKVTHIRVDKEGEFIDPWPHGFFNERAEELF